ncbi:hypothetical protein [Enterococcus sp. RIT-PI-f]|uniref:hypothetical protein n=1 Tax=Enterococcus sp. RIT-PI-f TaxID=1690244 RepID=UPI0006B9D820|nr:hypothetical protein [Enterococcus sp. RIT-PI-f]KPG70835.1 hypothetical protein AEQ18_06525 [Enterococcus sp. RIT-PI-f]
MRISQLQTKQSNRVNIEELHALNSAYGQRLSGKDLIFLIGYPAFIIGGLVFLMTYVWWAVVIAVLSGLYLGYKIILPQTVARRYETQSFLARNKFLTLMTQVMEDHSRTVDQSLQMVAKRLDGELQIELSQLIAALNVGSDPQRVSELLKALGQKYRTDLFFGQYLDQLETILQEGKENVEALQEILTYHNKVLEKMNEFRRIKDTLWAGVKIMTIAFLGMILLMHAASYIMTGNLDQYIQGFAHHFIGYTIAAICSVSFFFIFKKFFRDYFDDSVTELEVRTKK